VIGDQSETAEAEPNDEIAKAQPIKQLPALVNGQLDKSGDMDCYAVELKVGETFIASMQGRRLGSAIDPMIHLLDTAGNEVAYAQDGLGLDPLLIYKATQSGKYMVRVSAFFYPPAADVRLAGGKDAVYRLSLTTGPFVRTARPSGVQREHKSTVHLVGENITSDAIEVDATAALPTDDHLFIPIPGGESRLRIELGDAPELLYPPASQPAMQVTPPVNITSVIASAGAQDHFHFSAKKGEQLSFIIRAQSAGSPLDAVIKLQDSKGRITASNDDSAGASHDPTLDWDAGSDGDFQLTVSDLFQKGGPDYFYRLEINRRLPEIHAAPDSDAYLLAPGKTVAIKLQVTRKNGHAAPLMAVALNLPPGVTSSSAPVPAKGGDVTLMLSAAADTKPISAPIKLMLLGTDPAKPEARVITYDLHKDKDKPGVAELIDSTGDIWLTVSAEPPKPAAPK
jgi:hypothetical protein